MHEAPAAALISEVDQVPDDRGELQHSIKTSLLHRGLAPCKTRACRNMCDQVITRGTPPRSEGCRPASRSFALALMT